MENLLVTWRLNEALQNAHPMHYAASKGDVEVMKSLLGRGYLVNCMNFDLVTPLHEAATKGHVQAVQFLLDEGAWINATNIDGATPLCDACAAGHANCAEILLQRRATVNPPMPPISSPLHEAVTRGHLKCVNLLIASGAKLNATDCHFGTPLHAACAAYRISIECIKSLLQAGAEVNATMIHRTPLHIAACRKSLPLVQLLLNYGANVFMCDNMGKKPSDLALANPTIYNLLLKYELEPRRLTDWCRLRILRSFVIGRDATVVKRFGLPIRMVQFINGN